MRRGITHTKNKVQSPAAGRNARMKIRGCVKNVVVVVVIYHYCLRIRAVTRTAGPVQDPDITGRTAISSARCAGHRAALGRFTRFREGRPHRKRRAL